MSGLRISLSLCVALALLSASCKPGDDPKPVTPSQGLKSVKPEVQLPIVDGVYGAMYSIKISETINGQEKKSESASAFFYDVPSNTATATEFTTVEFIAVNQYDLNISDDYEYVRVGVQGGIIPDLDYENGIHWYIKSEDGPPVTFSWSSKFPEYAGTFPAAFSRNADLTFTFDNSTISSYTDSVYVTISAGDKMIVKRYGANQGKVTIPTSELIQLQACPADNPGYLQISAGVVDIFYLLAGNPTLVVKQQCDTRTVVIY